MQTVGNTLRDAFKAAKETQRARRLADLIFCPKQTFCPECSGRPLPSVVKGRGGLTQADAQTGLEGRLAWFPRQSDIPTYSFVHTQPAVNAGAYNHPCLILEESACRHYVFCAPVTGFGHLGLHGKYKKLRPEHDIFLEYLPIQNSKFETEAHDTLGMVEHTGGPLAKQSWVHLNCGFWIEWRFLQPLSVAGDKKPRLLSRKALSWTVWCYAVVEEHRQSRVAQANGPRTSTQPWAHPVMSMMQPSWALQQPCWPCVQPRQPLVQRVTQWI